MILVTVSTGLESRDIAKISRAERLCNSVHMSFVHVLYTVILYCGAMFAMTRCRDMAVIEPLKIGPAYNQSQETKSTWTVAVKDD
jgi:hypothetical protein